MRLHAHLFLCGLVALSIGCDPEGQDAPPPQNNTTLANNTSPNNLVANNTSPVNNQATNATTPTNSTTPASNQTTPPRGDAPEGAVTYHADIRPVMDRACSKCHVEGGISPFTLDYREEEWTSGMAWWSSIAVESVSSGSMPPWMPARDCRPLEGDFSLSPEEIALFEQWGEDGFWEGRVSDYEPAEAQEEQLDERRSPDLELALPEAYKPNTEKLDDYRCFVLDHAFEKDTFLLGNAVIPGQEDIVHHVIIYMIPPGDVAKIERLDGRDEATGYPCYGGPGSSLAQNVAGWVPGSDVKPLTTDSAVVVPAGAKLVAQMHYNTINVENGEEPPADLTRALFWTMPEGQTPTYELRALPLANLRIEIPAGESSSKHVQDYHVPYDAMLVGTTPHMHTLGATMKLEKVAGEGEMECLIDIPSWDFNWQQGYPFTSESRVSLKRGDVLRQTCTYDNSPANQQMVDGQPRTPETVYWGDGTFDEMCLTYALVAVPYSGEAGFDCSIVDECLAGCEQEDAQCMIECSLYSSSDCTACAFDEIFSCAGPKCASEGITLQGCTRRCSNAGEGIPCLENECAAEWADFYDCAIDTFQEGRCEVGVCGAE